MALEKDILFLTDFGKNCIIEIVFRQYHSFVASDGSRVAVYSVYGSIKPYLYVYF